MKDTGQTVIVSLPAGLWVSHASLPMELRRFYLLWKRFCNVDFHLTQSSKSASLLLPQRCTAMIMEETTNWGHPGDNDSIPTASQTQKNLFKLLSCWQSSRRDLGQKERWVSNRLKILPLPCSLGWVHILLTSRHHRWKGTTDSHHSGYFAFWSWERFFLISSFSITGTQPDQYAAFWILEGHVCECCTGKLILLMECSHKNKVVY